MRTHDIYAYLYSELGLIAPMNFFDLVPYSKFSTVHSANSWSTTGFHAREYISSDRVEIILSIDNPTAVLACPWSFFNTINPINYNLDLYPGLPWFHLSQFTAELRRR